MTENEVKESLSEGFIRLILSHDKFKVFDSKYDHGIDLSVGPVESTLLTGGEIMYEDSDRRMDIQLKCTTEKSIQRKGGYVIYHLRYKNYITLKKRVDSKYIKMILVLLILPEDELTWLNVVEDEMMLRKYCYWYIPDNSTVPPELIDKRKDYQVKIEIPENNHLLKDFRSIYNKINSL